MTFIHDEQNHHLACRVLDRITDEHVTPRPRWEFLMKNYVFWTLGTIAVLFGAVACSAMLFEITNADWRLSVATHTDPVSFFFAVAPFLWIGMLAIFVFVGYMNVRSTRHGYRYPLALIALGAVLTSLTLGSGLYVAGFGATIEESIGDHPPFYRPIMMRERSWWLAPQKGLLGGEVLQAAPNVASFALRDFSGQEWQVNGSDLSQPDRAVVARGGMVHVIGVPTESSIASTTRFHACFVFPWEKSGVRENRRVPSPLATVASTNAQDASFAHSDACKMIRPYAHLHATND